MTFRFPVSGPALVFSVCFIGVFVRNSVQSDERPPIAVPAGFRVEQFADDDLAHNIYSLTFDAQGQLVVSGPGYVRILLDNDNDGKADEYKTFADAPKTGAQGMFFMGPHLVASGDDGIQVFRDEDRNGKADGKPRTILNVKAGGEHHVHSIQRGPDGWWYVIAGNMTGVTSDYATLSTSPLKNPEAGVILRLEPDLAGGEILTDGFRNAYDFAFSESGDIFTFDSDGERDVSLPWYVPTRVIHATPRSHAGWVSRSWKRPVSFPDAPPTVASFGRGSPTGVICYRHDQFPSRYKGAIFVQDWTFGRILAVTLSDDAGSWNADAAIFAKGAGTFGFAPTDMEVAPDGSLYVSVGGRGTRGGVYRISYDQRVEASRLAPPPRSKSGALKYVLNAPQPFTSWSRARWYPVANELGKDEFAAAAIDELRTPAQRVRAVEILTDLFGGPDEKTLRVLIGARSAAVRARTAWAVGRLNPRSPDYVAIFALLNDEEPQVKRFALEALMGVTDGNVLTKCIPRLAVILGSKNRAVRSATSRLIPRLSDEQREQLSLLIRNNVSAQMTIAMGVAERSREFNPDTVKLAASVLASKTVSAELKSDAVRLLQLSLGDVGPRDGLTAVLEGYRARADLSVHRDQLAPVRKLIEDTILSGSDSLETELLRCISMLGSGNHMLVDAILQQITEESHPTDDIHRLIVLTACNAKRTAEQEDKIAAALVNLDLKVFRRQLKQDSNWDDRLTELFKLHADADSRIPGLMVDQEGFGLPGHIMFLSRIPAAKTQQAIDRFAERARPDPTYQWTNDLIFVLGRSKNPSHRQIIHQQIGHPVVNDAVLLVLARDPKLEDRQLYVGGLNSHQASVVKASIGALLKLAKTNEPNEQFALLATARRLSHNDGEFKLREDIFRMLQNNNIRSFGFIYGKEGYKPQPEAFNRWQKYLQERHPQLKHAGDGGRDAHQVLSALDRVDWEKGDAVRGAKLFDKLSCARCHGGRTALGPDLAGVAKRFSRPDLFASIVDPNRDISDRYQVTNVVTISGKVYSGLIVYESVDGITLRDADHKTIRIEAKDIESKSKNRVSLMPGGLLRNVSPEGLADLDAYLRTL